MRIALQAGLDDGQAVDALADHWGGRVGLTGALRDLNRDARWRPGPWPRFDNTSRVLLWDTEDSQTTAWYPQGITTSSDSGASPDQAVVLVSWYAAQRGAAADAVTRISVLDVTDRSRLRYRHVLLVRAVVDARSDVVVEPVRVHAGGLAWYGHLLHVAATYQGLRVFDLRDLLRVPPEHTAATFGHRYVLPQRFSYSAPPQPPQSMRYSFVSVDRTSTPPALVAGEYTRRPPARLARFDLDAVSDQLVLNESGTAVPSYVGEVGIRSMQGVVVVNGTYIVSASRGRFHRGDLWVGVPGSDGGLTRRRRALPAGPEDLAYWAERDELWALTEYPGRRHLFTLRLGAR